MKFGLLFLILVSALAQGQTFPRSTKVELAMVGASLAADGYTSFARGPKLESNPLARPFLHSPQGASVYFGGAFGGVVVGNWALRNHPKWRHVLNWGVVGMEGFVAFRNSRLPCRGEC